MGVFANHVHLFPEWMRADGTLEAFHRVMDEVGIDRAVLFAPFPHRWEEAGGAAGAGAPPMREQVRQVAEMGPRGLDWPAEAIDALLGGNLARVLG